MRFNRKGMTKKMYIHFTADEERKIRDLYKSCTKDVLIGKIVDLYSMIANFHRAPDNLLKYHKCQFTDGTQHCDCYIQAINDIKKKVL